jgi:hypothetical protein
MGACAGGFASTVSKSRRVCHWAWLMTLVPPRLRERWPRRSAGGALFAQSRPVGARSVRLALWRDREHFDQGERSRAGLNDGRLIVLTRTWRERESHVASHRSHEPRPTSSTSVGSSESTYSEHVRSPVIGW